MPTYYRPLHHSSDYIGVPYITRSRGEGALTTMIDVEVRHGRHVSARSVSGTLGAFVAQYNLYNNTHLIRVSGGGSYSPTGDCTTNSIYSALPTTTDSCGCESAHCQAHGGQLATDPRNTTGYPVSGLCLNPAGSYTMEFVGPICDDCAVTAAPDAPYLIKREAK
jgi:putative hemolysin